MFDGAQHPPMPTTALYLSSLLFDKPCDASMIAVSLHLIALPPSNLLVMAAAPSMTTIAVL